MAKVKPEDLPRRYQQQVAQQVGEDEPEPAVGVGKPSGSKYKNIPTEYNGRKYHSAGEARYAARLDLDLKAGRITGWEAQPRFIMLRPSPTATLALTKEVSSYTADFLIHHLDGTHKVVDWKGVEKQRDRDVRALWAAFGPYPLEIVYTTHTITVPAATLHPPEQTTE